MSPDACSCNATFVPLTDEEIYACFDMLRACVDKLTERISALEDRSSVLETLNKSLNEDIERLWTFA